MSAFRSCRNVSINSDYTTCTVGTLHKFHTNVVRIWETMGNIEMERWFNIILECKAASCNTYTTKYAAIYKDVMQKVQVQY